MTDMCCRGYSSDSRAFQQRLENVATDDGYNLLVGKVNDASSFTPTNLKPKV